MHGSEPRWEANQYVCVYIANKRSQLIYESGYGYNK